MIDLEPHRDRINAALAYSGGTHFFEDVVDAVRAGKMQAWINGDTIAITEIIVYPRKRVLHCFLASGTMQGVIDMMDDASMWGRMQGCTAFTVAGRKGWARVLGRHGWREAMRVLEVEL